MNTKRNIKPIIILLLTMLMFASGSLFSQHRGAPPPIPSEKQINKMMEDLTAELSLNGDQQENIHSLFTKHFDELREKMEEHKAEKRQEREEMEQHREEFESKVKSLLDEVQQEKFDEFMEKHKPRKKHGKQAPCKN